MEIVNFVLGELATNTYLVICKKTKKCLIIDPADDANFLIEKILQLKLNPVAIVATHGHFDHILAANELQSALKIPFLIHKNDQKIINYMNRSAQWWLKRKIFEKPPKINDFLTVEAKLKFGNEFLSVIETPGHSPGGVCLYNRAKKIVFTGDTLFVNGVGRTDFPYGSPLQIKRSLFLIAKKFFGFTAYPGHGEFFKINDIPL